MFRWEIEVLEYNTYGDKIVKRTPMSVLAPTKTGVTEKVRAAFEAKYDGFRKFWSHGWTLISVSEPMSGSTDPSPNVRNRLETDISSGQFSVQADGDRDA